jgi:membrane-bound ClpP family serine protease
LAEDALDPTVRNGYVEIAERRRTIPQAVVLGMLDPQLAVSRVQTQDGVRFVLSDELDQLQKQSAVRSVEQVIPAGQLGNFTGTELRLKYGLASHLVRDRLQLAAALQLPPGGVEEDPTLAVGRRAVRVDLSGPIKPDTVSWVERGIREKIEQEQVNFVCLVIDSPGGSPEDSMRLATYLSSLDPGQVRTVAFVASEARADAALIALACDQLLMTDTAVLGGPGARRISSRKSEALRTAVRELAKTKSIGWSLPAAMIDADLSVQRYQRPGTGEVRYFCGQELAEQEHPQDWRAEGDIETRNGLRGSAAVELRLARFNVADWDDLKRTYHFEGELGMVQRNWAHTVVEFLASPRIAGMLLFAAWFTLMIEFSTPGIGVPGFASAVCFVLFFWANFLHGTAGWLEIMLFVTGVVCLIIEIFVLPGVGAFGIGGGLLIVVSILLASQTFLIPSNAYEWSQLPSSLFMVAAAGAGAFAALIVARRLVTDVPVFRRVSLETPDEQQREQIRRQEALVHLDYLVGKRGVTITQLTPSGKARFGDARVDVISDGEVIPYETDVVVVEVRGNEVLVRALEIG